MGIFEMGWEKPSPIQVRSSKGILTYRQAKFIVLLIHPFNVICKKETTSQNTSTIC